jgi:hypothetical protein
MAAAPMVRLMLAATDTAAPLVATGEHLPSQVALAPVPAGLVARMGREVRRYPATDRDGASVWLASVFRSFTMARASSILNDVRPLDLSTTGATASAFAARSSGPLLARARR